MGRIHVTCKVRRNGPFKTQDFFITYELLRSGEKRFGEILQLFVVICGVSSRSEAQVVQEREELKYRHHRGGLSKMMMALSGDTGLASSIAHIVALEVLASPTVVQQPNTYEILGADPGCAGRQACYHLSQCYSEQVVDVMCMYVCPLPLLPLVFGCRY